jgi:hypothetical protein
VRGFSATRCELFSSVRENEPNNVRWRWMGIIIITTKALTVSINHGIIGEFTRTLTSVRRRYPRRLVTVLAFYSLPIGEYLFRRLRSEVFLLRLRPGAVTCQDYPLMPAKATSKMFQ